MNSKKIRKITLAVFAVALVALLAGCAVACDKETPQLTVNAELAFTYGDAPSEWTIVLDGAAEGETAESLGIADDIVLPTAEEITSLGVGTYTFDVDVSGATASGYKLMGGVATLTVRPRALDVEVGSQEIAYSPDGARPYTDGTQATVSGLLDGHRIEIGLTADCEAVPNAGTVADILFDGTVKVYDGNEDVTDNYAVSVVVKEGAVMTVVKAKADVVAVAEVDYDGNPHSFADSGYRVILPEGCDQEYTVTQADAKYTLGGIYSAAVVTLTETDNYVGQTVEGLLKIKSVKVGDTTYTLEDALFNAESGDVVIVCNDTVVSTVETYSAQTYRTVKEGVTLLLPYDERYTTSLVDIWADRAGGKTVPEPYVTLYVSEGLEISVEGTFTVNARRTANNTNMMGMAYENALLNFAEGSSVVVYDGGTFNCLGYATGEGTVVARSGGTVSETLVITGYRGGTISQKIYKEVFPFNQYMLNNIETKAVYEAGSQLVAKASVVGGFLGSNIGMAADIYFIGQDDAMINIISGSLTKEYNSENGETTLTVSGECDLNNLALSVGFAGIGLTLDSEGQEIPFPGNFDIVVASGTVNLDGVRVKLLPGCDMTIENGATVNLMNGAGIFVYNNQDFGWTKDGTIAYPVTNSEQCYRVKPTLDYNITTQSVFVVDGTLSVDSTSFVAGLISTSEGGQISFATVPQEVSIKEFESNTGTYTYFTMTGIADLGTDDVLEAGVYVSKGGIWKKQ